MATGAATQINLREPVNPEYTGKFVGALYGGKIADKGNITYFTENGDRCSDSKSTKCVIALRAQFRAACATGACGLKQKPDILKVSVEMKDHRDENKNLLLVQKNLFTNFTLCMI